MHGELPVAQNPSATEARKEEVIDTAATRPIGYILFIIAAAVSVYLYQLRSDGIFACQSGGYTSDAFLSECSARQYGNYEHGAFWFGLEPAALDAASRAQVLFLGDSRLQVAFSTPETENWFDRSGTSFYLLGFGAGENMNFTGKLLEKLNPQAITYIINADRFFETWLTIPAKELFRDPSIESRYKHKQNWQIPHRYICDLAPMACGNNFVAFRSKATGVYQIGGEYDADGRRIRGDVVSYDHSINHEDIAKYVSRAEQFFSQFGMRRECVIFTVVPYAGTRVGTVRALAAALGTTFVAPEIDGLRMFDPTHLDQAGARAWSQKFYEAAGPAIERCVASPASRTM